MFGEDSGDSLILSVGFKVLHSVANKPLPPPPPTVRGRGNNRRVVDNSRATLLPRLPSTLKTQVKHTNTSNYSDEDVPLISDEVVRGGALREMN